LGILGSAPLFLEKMRSRAETEMRSWDVKRIQRRVSSIGLCLHWPVSLDILLRKLPGKVLEKFQIFSERPNYAGSQFWGAQAAWSCRLADNTFA
jgi:hypothetical protein